MPMPRQRRIAVLLFAFVCVAATAADSPTDLYVSVAHGSDAAAGDSPAAAVRSLHRAAELVQAGQAPRSGRFGRERHERRERVERVQRARRGE